MKLPAILRPRPERAILLALLALCGFGLVMVYSSSAVLAIAVSGSSAHFFEKHLIKLLGGLVILVSFWRLDYHHLDGRIARWSLAPVFGVLTALAIQHFATGEVSRWLRLGGLTVQPSEFARVALVLFLASAFSRTAPSTSSSRWIAVPAAVVLAMAGLVICQPNLSVAILILSIGFAMLFLAGVAMRKLLIGSGAGILVAGIGLQAYQGERIAAFWRWLRSGEAGYQLDQSITAVGSGGVIGPGPGSGLQKYFFLPFPHTDFILGIVGEETGLLGLTILFAVYGSLIVMGMAAARRAPDRFGSLLAAGLTLNLSLNVLVHGAVNLGLIPVTGVPLPFLSCGGSALVANLLAMGIVLSVARRSIFAPARDWSAIGGFRR